jgi:pantoate--beta-alanine ligase
VVLRFFKLVRPRQAVFGEKDWQQLQVIAAMVEHERLGIDIVPVPTVRETDGLAMSSRNRFLSPADRHTALSLNIALRSAISASPAAAERIMHRTLTFAGLSPDYAVVRDAKTLLPPVPTPAESSHLPRPPLRALIAARVGPVRLIDNAPWPPPSDSASPHH